MVRSVEGSNAANVQLGLIEQLAGYQRRRNSTGDESFGVNSDPSRWLTASSEGVEPDPFMSHAFEANAVWDEHMASVGNDVVRKVHEDDWFANALHCVQAIEVNFCGRRQTEHEREQRRAEAAAKNPRDSGGSDWQGGSRSGWAGV
jgi:chloramphenicol 3-O-phosphotransferase